MNNCVVCNKVLIGKQKLYCNKKCRRIAEYKKRSYNKTKYSKLMQIYRNKSKIFCPICNNKMESTSKICFNCKTAQYKKITIGEYRNKITVKGKHPSWLHAEIRNFARSWNKDLVKLQCQNCGYSKHINLCHIKAVVDFDDDILLSHINSPDNLLVLCPNCHWEFDNGFLELNDIPTRK